jgi:hypothetical protein
VGLHLYDPSKPKPFGEHMVETKKCQEGFLVFTWLLLESWNIPERIKEFVGKEHHEEVQ